MDRTSKGSPFAFIIVLALTFVWWEYQQQAAQRRRDQVSRQALADQAKKYRELESRLLDRFQSRTMDVLGELPSEFDVMAVGAHGGKRQIDVNHPNHNGLGHIDVIVNHPDRPLVLVVTAYLPTVWRIGRTDETRIVAVIASGYHTQLVMPPSLDTLPIANSTYDEYRNFRYFSISRSDDPELLTADKVIRQLTGRGIERFYAGGSEADVIHVGRPPTSESRIHILDDESFLQHVQSHLSRRSESVNVR